MATTPWDTTAPASDLPPVPDGLLDEPAYPWYVIAELRKLGYSWEQANAIYAARPGTRAAAVKAETAMTAPRADRLTARQEAALAALRWAEMRVASTGHPSRYLDNSYGEDTRALTRARAAVARLFPQGVPA